MPFGKHRGQHIADVPSDYLQWAYHNATALHGWQRALIGQELERRSGRGRGDGPTDDDTDAPDEEEYNRGYRDGLASGQAQARRSGLEAGDLEARIGRWHRRLAMTYHPDRTLDSGKVMAALNAAVADLRKALELS